jgi:GMP synthase (glutamine-hydrolysing)
MTTKNRVAILDAGGQYVDLVRKAVERQGVPADILPLKSEATIIEKVYGAIIISGSPASSHAESAPQPDPAVWESSLPLLGICYGMQAMAVAHGAQVVKNAIREDGRVVTEVDINHPLFKGTKRHFSGLFTHGDFIKTIPLGFDVLGSHKLSDGSLTYSSIAKGNKYGVQFHPEVFDDTPQGYQLFKNFLDLAGIKADQSFRDNQLEKIIDVKQRLIKSLVGTRPVIAFVSGGVDSSVTISLAAPVIPADHLHAYYIDHGFMRDEDEQVIEVLQAAGISVTKVDAASDFENATAENSGPLVETVDPETKRKIIGKAFVDVQNKLVHDLKLNDAMLLQGTNAADRIESGHSNGDANTMTIKTHHNQVKEVQDLKLAGRLIEPIDDLFKDEVRELGRQLGLPEELVERQPFPGPGLAIRIIATAESEEKLKTLPEEPIIQVFLDKNFAGTKAHLLPVRSVGVGGDERSHLSVVAIEGDLKTDDLIRVGSDLPAHFRETINRVIYSIGNKSLTEISQTKTLLSADVRAQLRLADRIVFEEMREYNLLDKITQFPVVLLPISFDKPNQRSIVLRPVYTTTFMTVQAMLPGRDLPVGFFERINDRILKEDPNISQVFLDLTNKPPATTEWE